MNKKTEQILDLDARIERFNHCVHTHTQLTKHARFLRLSIEEMKKRKRDGDVTKEYGENALSIFRDELHRIENAMFR